MAEALEKCRLLEDINVWPTQPRLKAQAWLENFRPVEKPHANALLSSFMYFNEFMCAQLLRSAFSKATEYFYQFELGIRRAAWQEFLETAIFTYPAGENPSKSGPTVLRTTRQELGFGEERMYSPTDALEALADGKSRYVVFVDDFVGSGDQFTETWHEPHIRRGQELSFKQVCEGGVVAFYLPYLATSYGMKQIGHMCENYQLFAGQILGDQYCAFAEDSIIWPDSLRATADEFLREASFRGGITQYKGHHGLGFAVAAHKSIPDICLPLLFHRTDDWRPLMERK